jgi:hypothetical protein
MNKNVMIISLVAVFVISIIAGPGLRAATPIDLKLSRNKNVTPRLRNTGIAFLCFGVATIAGGAAMVHSANGVTYYNSQTTNGYNQSEGSFSGAMGALGIVGGSIATLGGGLMTFFGQRKLNKSGGAHKRVSFILTPISGSIAYQF